MNQSDFENQRTAVTRRKPIRSGDVVDTVYKKLNSLIIELEIKPGERVNEVNISRYLGVSRTSLREAMNRLLAKGILRFVPNKGFFVKDFDVEEIMQVFEARLLLEVGITSLVIDMASDDELKQLREYWDAVMGKYREEGADSLVASDAEFHERMAALTKNNVLVGMLSNINKRIQLIRWVRLKGLERYETFEEHYKILDALESRDKEQASAVIQSHIDHRGKNIERAMADGLLHIYSKKKIGIN